MRRALFVLVLAACWPLPPARSALELDQGRAQALSREWTACNARLSAAATSPAQLDALGAADDRWRAEWAVEAGALRAGDAHRAGDALGNLDAIVEEAGCRR